MAADVADITRKNGTSIQNQSILDPPNHATFEIDSIVAGIDPITFIKAYQKENSPVPTTDVNQFRVSIENTDNNTSTRPILTDNDSIKMKRKELQKPNSRKKLKTKFKKANIELSPKYTTVRIAPIHDDDDEPNCCCCSKITACYNDSINCLKVSWLGTCCFYLYYNCRCCWKSKCCSSNSC